jgi:hypothetical protein
MLTGLMGLSPPFLETANLQRFHNAYWPRCSHEESDDFPSMPMPKSVKIFWWMSLLLGLACHTKGRDKKLIERGADGRMLWANSLRRFKKVLEWSQAAPFSTPTTSAMTEYGTIGTRSFRKTPQS